MWKYWIMTIMTIMHYYNIKINDVKVPEQECESTEY